LASAKELFPYTAVVTVDEAIVRSGPGRVHYSTSRLERGETVEVWRHDLGGWCAIRPTSESYSLVPMRHLQIAEAGDIAEITQDNVAAWVASQLGDVDRLLCQVHLDRGEQVYFLGTVELPDSSAGISRILAKIAPPSGEFRWIHINDLQRATSTTDPDIATQSWTKRSTSMKSKTGQITLTSLIEPTATLQGVIQTIGDFQGDIDKLQVDLSLMVSRSAEERKLDELRRRATSLVGGARDDYQRGQARLIVDRISAFDDIHRRLESDDAVTVNYRKAASRDQSGVEQASGLRPVGTGVQLVSYSNPPNGEPRFDGRGWLIRVHSRQGDVPKYALADLRGEIKTFVAPAPGLNLHRYLNEEIGVFGKQGLLKSLRTHHITVHRVVVLSRHR